MQIEYEPMLPPVPDAPSLAQPAASLPGLPDRAALDALVKSSRSAQPSIEDGFKGSLEGVDWKSEIGGFLDRGNAEREAEDAVMQRKAAESVFPSGRTVQDEMRDDLAFRGLQSARDRLDPAFNRRQKSADMISGAETFMDPTVMRARQQEQAEAVSQQRGMRELAIQMGLDPDALKLSGIDFERKKELAGIDAAGRSGMFGVGGGGGDATAPRGTAPTRTEYDIRREGAAKGWPQQDIEDTIADARAKGQIR